jgi:hypothetical protein
MNKICIATSIYHRSLKVYRDSICRFKRYVNVDLSKNVADIFPNRWRFVWSITRTSLSFQFERIRHLNNHPMRQNIIGKENRCLSCCSNVELISNNWLIRMTDEWTWSSSNPNSTTMRYVIDEDENLRLEFVNNVTFFSEIMTTSLSVGIWCLKVERWEWTELKIIRLFIQSWNDPSNRKKSTLKNNENLLSKWNHI